MSGNGAVSGGGPGIEAVPLREDSAARWGDSVTQWRQYVDKKEGQSLVFIGDSERNKDEFLVAPYTHRFLDEYTSMQYAQLMDFARGARDEYDDPHVVLLGLTASTTTQAGNLRPPLDHLDELLSAWDRGVRYELNHVMEADRQKDDYKPLDFEYLQIREPHTDSGDVPGGYAHIHPVIVCDGEPERERFERVIDKHVEKCDLAQYSAHNHDESIDIRRMDEIGNLGAYLFKYLGKSWGGDLEPYQRRFNALLWESGRRRFQPSDGAQRWMSREDSESVQSWIFAGVANEEKVARLEGYDDAEELRIDKEMGVRSYLNEREAREAVAFDDSDHKFQKGRCVRCGVSETAMVAGRVWWEGGPSKCPGGDRPPPG